VAELVGSAAVVVGLGMVTVVVEVVGVAGALVVLAVVGAIVIVPVFAVDDVLLRRVRSWPLLDTGMVEDDVGAVAFT
jgi:hypothetical protein